MEPYIRFSSRGMNWLIAQEYQDVVYAITDIPEKLPAKAQVIKENMVRQSSVTPLQGHGKIFVKRYKMKGWGESLKYLFLPSKADREWRNILFFKRCHLPTVTPVAKGIKRQGGLLKDSLLVMQHIPGCQTLKTFSQSIRNQSSRDCLTRKEAIITEAARKIRMIHDKGFFYRDLHAGNILIQEDTSGKFNLFFVDLHKAW
ncbi:MAG TPA: lipopolysaccharide kinase InaA family protein, partial [Thermodesulfobacteriota bacterium]|nr:lipopolysaccharide kinase InaA family protein [Thermodesulfobacteriota bacterium]